MVFDVPDVAGRSDREKHMIALDVLHAALMTMNALDVVGGVNYAGSATHVPAVELRPFAALSVALDVAVAALVADDDNRYELREALRDTTVSACEVLARLEGQWHTGAASEHGRRVAQAYTTLATVHGGKVTRPGVPERFANAVLAPVWLAAFEHEVQQHYLDRN
jgi:hypothetical protein